MSFDLLNDKISFLNEGPSWGGGEDDTFDFKKEEAKIGDARTSEEDVPRAAVVPRAGMPGGGKGDGQRQHR